MVTRERQDDLTAGTHDSGLSHHGRILHDSEIASPIAAGRSDRAWMAHLGWMAWLPPGLPGGGITGVVPGSGTGAGALMSGSMPAGGWITPSV
jgi:hypothetical protein